MGCGAESSRPLGGHGGRGPASPGKGSMRGPGRRATDKRLEERVGFSLGRLGPNRWEWDGPFDPSGESKGRHVKPGAWDTRGTRRAVTALGRPVLRLGATRARCRCGGVFGRGGQGPPWKAAPSCRSESPVAPPPHEARRSPGRRAGLGIRSPDRLVRRGGGLHRDARPPSP
jgi:hypothetical protein